MLPGKRSCKLIRNDITFQGHGPIFCADEDTNIAQYFFPFLKRKSYVFLERAQYIRSERKEAAQNCHQVHSVDTLLTVEIKAN
jgi:hypothetical protein